MKAMSIGLVLPTESVHGYYNLTAVHDDGSAVSSQVWSAAGQGPKEAALRVLDWVKRGEVPGQTWDRPVAHVFIHFTGNKSTCHYILSNVSHVAALKVMAA